MTLDALNDPRVQPDAYIVYPTGYDDMVNSDKYHWCLHVINGHSYGWSVRPGRGSSSAMNRKGKMIYETSGSGSNRFRRYSLEEALGIALQYVDSYVVNGCTASQASEWVAAKIASGEIA